MKSSTAAKATAPVKITATALRQNIYAVLDEVLATGRAMEIERKGQVLRIVAGHARQPNETGLPPGDAEEFPKLARLKNHNWVVGNLEDFDHIDWSSEWSELKK